MARSIHARFHNTVSAFVRRRRKSASRLPDRRQRRFESLEDRTLLAADLLAVANDGFNASTLYALDSSTGAVDRVIGNTGETGRIAGIDVHPITGEVYAVTGGGPQQLLKIDPLAATVTPIGPAGFNQITDISFRSDGTLFGWATSGPDAFFDLATINLDTGALTIISSNVGASYPGVAFDSADNLYMNIDTFFSGGALLQVDPTTGNQVAFIPLSDPQNSNFNVLDFSSTDVLYTAKRLGDFNSGDSLLQTINTTNGSVTTVGTVPGVAISAMTFFDFGLSVASTVPANGSVVFSSTPTEYVVNVNDPVDASTLDASDFQVNGNAATGVSYTPGSTAITFTFSSDPVTSQGLQTMHVAEGAFKSLSDGMEVAEFNGSFRYDALLMEVTSTDPADGSVVLLPFTTLDLNFNEDYDPASAQPIDFSLNQGSVSAVSQVDADTLRLTLDGVDSEGTLTVNLAAGAMTDVYGNAGAAYTSSYTLDFGTVPYPVPLTPKAPLGSLIYDPSQSGIIDPAGDTDSFTVLIDPGQLLTLVVSSDAGLQSTVEVRNQDGELIGSGVAGAAGESLVLQNLPTHGQLGQNGPPAKTYTITVSGADETTGGYNLQVILNASVEEENYGGGDNGSLESAQSLEPAFLPLHESVVDDGEGRPERTAVLGKLEAFTLIPIYEEDFETDAHGFTVDNSGAGFWHLSTGRGEQPGHSASQSFYFGQNEGPNGGGSYQTFSGSRTVGTITSPPIELPAAPTVVDFNHVLATRVSPSDVDFASLQINDGSGWTELERFDRVAETSTWATTDLVSLADYAGETVQLRWSFDTGRGPVGRSPEGWYVDDVRISEAVLNDYYSLELQAGESATVALTELAGSNADVTLVGPDGRTLALGRTGSSNVDESIGNFVAAVSGTYYLQVTGNPGTEYSLVVTRNADFDIENNNNIDSAQELLSTQVAGRQWALGAIAAGNSDFYQVTLGGGKRLEVETSTPGARSGEFENLFNPAIRVYDASGNLVASDDNGAPDGRNARLAYRVPSRADGTYFVEVVSSGATAEPTLGEYLVAIKGGTGKLPAFEVATSDPFDGQRLRGPTTQITVDFNDTVLLTSLDASDLTVDGTPVTSFTVVDGNTVTFELPVLAEGNHTVRIAAGAVVDVQSTPLESFEATFYEDLTPPTIVASSIQEDDVLPAGDLTYTVTFSEPMQTANLDASDFALRGTLINNITYSPEGFAYDESGTVLTLQYSNLPEDRYSLLLRSGDGRFEDSAEPNGFDLDGEPVAFPIPGNQSGDGVEGGDFVVNFDLDVVTAPYPVPLEPKAPLGSLIYDRSVTAFIQPADDTDSFTIALDAGQTMTVVVDPNGAQLQPTVEIFGPSGALLGSSTAAAAGETAVLQTVLAASAGTYTITVGGAAGTGLYTAQLILNAAVEDEAYGGAANGTLATAQDLEASFINLVSGSGDQPSRGAVIGQLEAPLVVGTVFLADFESGAQGFTVDNTGGGSPGFWHLSTGRGTQPGHSASQSFYFGQNEGPDGGGNYQTGTPSQTVGTITSPSIALPADGTLLVDFNHVLATREFPPDVDFAELRINDGSGWTALQRYDRREESSSWTTTEPVNLSAYAGQMVQLQWSFDTRRGPVGRAPEGWYVDDVRVVQAELFDFYSFDLQAGESATVALTVLSGTTASVALVDADGNTLAEGLTGPSNVDEVISNFVAPASGTYYVQVTGETGTVYSLLATRNADFDTEGNDDIASAQEVLSTQVAGGQWVLGHLEQPPSNLINNGSFETGDFTGWTTATTGGAFVDWTVSGAGAGSGFFPATSPQDGDFVAWNGFDGFGPMEFTMVQDVTIPSDAPSADLQWQDRVQWNYTFGGFEPTGRSYFVEILDPGSNDVLDTVFSFDTGTQDTNPVGDTGWQTHSADLAAHIGSTVRLRFRQVIPNAQTGPGQIEFDAIRLDYRQPGKDFYQVTLVEGQPLEVETSTPGAGVGEFVNLFDPEIRVYDGDGNLVASNDNGAADGRNSRLTYHVPAGGGGTYYVEVTASGATEEFTSGEYILSLKGNVAGESLYLDGAPHFAEAAPLSDAALQKVVSEAIGFWRSEGVDGASLNALARINVRTDNLVGSMLGHAFDSGIVIDHNAAGHGWSVGAGSSGGVDLFSTVVHELGHVLGFDHLNHVDQLNVMRPTLAAGRTLFPAFVDEGNIMAIARTWSRDKGSSLLSDGLSSQGLTDDDAASDGPGSIATQSSGIEVSFHGSNHGESDDLLTDWHRAADEQEENGAVIDEDLLDLLAEAHAE